MSKYRTCNGCVNHDVLYFKGGTTPYHYCLQGDKLVPCDGNGCNNKKKRRKK